MKLKDACSLDKSYDQPRQHIKKQKHYFANKSPSNQSYVFSSSDVWMWELDYKESWVPKNWCFWNVVLEKTLESPLDCKEIKRINPKGNQSWIIIRRTDAVLKSYTLATWWEKLIYWKRPWCWERLKAGGEGDDRGWDGWLASLIHWTWVWANSRRWWRMAKPGVLQSMGSQRVRHNWVTGQQQNKEARTFLYCWKRFRFVQSLWREIWQYLTVGLPCWLSQ